VLGSDWWFTHGVAASLALFFVMEENLFLRSGKLFEDTYQQPAAVPKHKYTVLVKCSFLAYVQLDCFSHYLRNEPRCDQQEKVDLWRVFAASKSKGRIKSSFILSLMLFYFHLHQRRADRPAPTAFLPRVDWRCTCFCRPSTS
jgi:hypothetical protein